MTRPQLREWQHKALARWEEESHRGIISVVTGGGKTVFALACIDRFQADTSVVVVPTVALLDQWWEEVASYFGMELDEVHVLTGNRSIRTGTINIAVLNTASKLDTAELKGLFLVVDECHKAASEQFRKVLEVPKVASLGLSATPERPYDDWLNAILVPALGPVIFEYTYKDALRDGVIVPFELRNVVFELENDRQQEYDRLTKAIARAIKRFGVESEQAVSLLLRRSRVLNLSLSRITLALRLVAANRGKRIIVFHEDIEACNLIVQVLAENSVKSGVYHSKMPLKERARALSAFRRGEIGVLVTCRALDEGFNVPEADVGIIAASTATRRQRIQRLGRVLRPSGNKAGATIYTLVATEPEVARLKEEEKELDGVANVSWSRA